MNIGDKIISGAASQFGREFGRAGANQILKGKNAIYHQQVGQTESDLTGRIKSSDSHSVILYKEIRKVNFVSTEKANFTRMIKLFSLVNEVIDTTEINCYTARLLKDTLDLYIRKIEQGRALFKWNYNEESMTDKDVEAINRLNKLNEQATEILRKIIDIYTYMNENTANFHAQVEADKKAIADARRRQEDESKTAQWIIAIVIGIGMIISAIIKAN